MGTFRGEGDGIGIFPRTKSPRKKGGFRLIGRTGEGRSSRTREEEKRHWLSEEGARPAHRHDIAGRGREITLRGGKVIEREKSSVKGGGLARSILPRGEMGSDAHFT